MIGFAKSVSEKKYTISRDNLSGYYYSAAKHAMSNFNRILAQDAFDEDLANMALDIVIHHNDETFEIKNVLKAHQWKNTQAVNEILTKIETEQFSTFGIRDNLNILSYLSKESLQPHKARILASIKRHPIKNSRTQERFQKTLGL